MVELLLPMSVPLMPAPDAEFTHGCMLFILSVIHANYFADIGGGSIGMRQRTLVDQSDLPAALAEFQGGREAEAAAAENDKS